MIYSYRQSYGITKQNNIFYLECLDFKAFKLYKQRDIASV